MATAILAGLTAIYPELALMAAQASAVGLALVLLAVFLRQLTAGSRQPLLAEVSSAVAPILPLPRPSEPPVPVVAASGSSAGDDHSDAPGRRDMRGFRACKVQVDA